MSYQTGTGATHNVIRKIMGRRRKWWSPMDLQIAFLWETGQVRTDATLTRRLREMTDVVCEARTIKGKTRWEYRLVKSERAVA